MAPCCDDCLAAGLGRASLAPTCESQTTAKLPSHSYASDSQLSEAQGSDDLMRLADEIENRLHLKNVEPKPFSQGLLDKEGLRRSRGQFEDFEERGQRVVYLIVAPGTLEVFEPTKADTMLHFEPLDDEITA